MMASTSVVFIRAEIIWGGLKIVMPRPTLRDDLTHLSEAWALGNLKAPQETLCSQG